MAKPKHFYTKPEGETGELLNDTSLRRNYTVEERYNIKPAFHLGPGNDSIKDVQQVVMAGESSFDLVQFASAWNKIMPLVQDHALLNLLDLPHANLDADYFYGHLNEQLTIHGKLYTGFSNYNNSGTMPLYMVFNKNMMTDMGMEMPYEAILNGDWTYDVFLGYIKDAAVDLDGDGKQENTDQWGFANGAITPVSMMNNIKDPGAVVSHLTSVESKAVAMAEEFFAIFFEE